jgi:hypothetical protein
MLSTLRDSIHRGMKGLLDTGEARSLDEARQILERYRLAIYVGPEVLASPSLQAALLTAVNTGARSCLGGVEVTTDRDGPLALPFAVRNSLHDAIRQWGGTLVADPNTTAPALVLGTVVEGPERHALAARVSFDGWSAGVAPLEEGWRLPEAREFAPAGVLAGALAVSEAFQALRGRNAPAMRRRLVFSLWRPELVRQERDAAEPEPHDLYLPQAMWLVGLGHLGQAFVWSLATLPYRRPEEVRLVLQDTDRLVEANLSTSLLTVRSALGEKKTRHIARFCEGLVFQTAIVERPFDDHFTRSPEDPALLICGVDNAATRRILARPGFPEIIEAGLGHGADEYLAFQLHTFPASRGPEQTWPDGPWTDAGALIEQPGYQELLEKGADECGVTQLAGCAVGAPFVGAAVSALMVAEAVRAAMGVHRYEVIDGTLRRPDQITVLSREPAHSPVNLGFALCRC